MSKTFKLHNQQIELQFPDTGDAWWNFQNILAGNDYPILPEPLEPQNIIDIGANVGAASIFFSSAYPNANIFSFEPSPSNFEYLKINVIQFPKIKAYNFGLSDEDAELKLYLGRSQCLQHSVIPSIEVSDNFEMIKLRKASDVINKISEGRSILKIDTEGCEVQILNSLKKFLDTVDIVYLEYHSERDRITIDTILSPMFSLWHSAADKVHRGNLAYLSHQLLSTKPSLGKWELKC